MKMQQALRYILPVLLVLCAAFGAQADPNWKMHVTYADEVTRVVDTPAFTYFTVRTQPYDKWNTSNNTEWQSLFRYDKENDELMSLSTDNVLSSNSISLVEYSPEKNYLAVVHHDCSVDLLHDSGKAESIQAYRHAEVANGKAVKCIFIDPADDRIYLGTGFGYVALNDRKLEVAESRDYGKEIKGIGRVGDNLLLMYGVFVYAAPLSERRMNFSDYKHLASYSNGDGLVNIGTDVCLAHVHNDSGHYLQAYRLTDGELKATRWLGGDFSNYERTQTGLLAYGPDTMWEITADGTVTESARNGALESSRIGAYRPQDEIWCAGLREGFWSEKPAADGGVWTVTRQPMFPNSPSPYKVQDMVWHPELGLLVSSHGFSPNFMYGDNGGPQMLSSYRDGVWTNHSPAFVNKDMTGAFKNPNGLAVDPYDRTRVYCGSVTSGIRRINLGVPNDLLHLTRPSDPDNGLDDFVAFFPDQTGNPSAHPDYEKSSKSSCAVSGPRFDYNGNMWFAHNDLDDQNDAFKLHLYVWLKDDRLASVTPQTVRLPKPLTVKGYLCNNRELLVPLTASRQRNILVYTQRKYAGELVLIDTKGTPDDGSDDTTVAVATFTDQDGNAFDVHDINDIYEDTQTGNVWVGHANGVFHFKPENFFGGTGRVSRIKVARNDGTNLADYLLDAIPVNKIAVDGQGRKWFATTGAGVVCTSSDGRTVQEELTTAEHPLPSDIIYGVCHVPQNNSMMIATDGGLCEYFMPGAASAGSGMEVRAYPNPVRPDYFGYVTIDGLPDNTLVKIADAAGNVVKELGAITGGEVKWDVTNHTFKRVQSGVYFILASTDEGGGNLASVGKILVVN